MDQPSDREAVDPEVVPEVVEVEPEVIDVDPGAARGGPSPQAAADSTADAASQGPSQGTSEAGGKDSSSKDSRSKDSSSNGPSGFQFDGLLDDLLDGKVFKKLNIEVDPDAVDESVERLTRQVRKAVVRGRYTKVRVKYRGKPLMRDIPLGVFVAAEAVSFWYVGLLRALVVNLGARTIIEVEFIHEADEDVEAGRVAYEAGEVADAEEAFRRALDKESEHEEARYRLGILLRVTGKRDEALELLREVAAAKGELAERAQEAIERMERGPRTL